MMSEATVRRDRAGAFVHEWQSKTVHQSKSGWSAMKGCRESMHQWNGPPKTDGVHHLIPWSTDQTVSFILIHTANKDETVLLFRLEIS